MIPQILEIVKLRLNRTDTVLDDYFTERIKAAITELDGNGIHIQTTSRDIIFVADLVCWQYSNRDKPNAMPEWQRLARRERLLAEVRND